MTLNASQLSTMAHTLASNGRSKSCVPSARQLNEMPEEVLLRICGYLAVDDLCAMEITCSLMREMVGQVWTRHSHTCLDVDLADVARMFPSSFTSTMCRFSLPPDNLWAHNRSELDVLFPEPCLLTAYADLAFFTRKCTALESISLLSAPYKPYRVPAGRSFFRFLSSVSLETVTRLDLTMTSFELADLELCQHSFSYLKELIVDKCCIYVYRREVLLLKPEKELKSVLANFQKRIRKIPVGAKLFLATVADMYPDLSYLSAKSTEYRSNGCITYGYGEDEPDAEYELLPRRRRRSYCAALLKRAAAQFHTRMQSERVG